MADSYGPFRDVDADGNPVSKAGFWDRLNSMAWECEWTIASEGGNAIVVTVQIKDAKSRNLARYVNGTFSLHDSDTNGASYGAVSTTAEGLSVSTGTMIADHISGDVIEVQSDSDGKFAISISETTGADWYKMQLKIGDRVFQSPLITFA